MGAVAGRAPTAGPHRASNTLIRYTQSMTKPLIIDLHLDLAWDAVFWNRDLTLTAQQVRDQEESEIPQVADDYNTGTCTVTFPEMRRGRVGIMLSTIMSRIEPRYRANRRDGMRTQEQAMAMGRGHLAYYEWERARFGGAYNARYGMDGLVPHIEHIAELAGGSLDNIAIGTDMDGGFGAELTPTDVDTIADLQGFAPVLRDAGVSKEDVDGILHGNALRFFRQAWSG